MAQYRPKPIVFEVRKILRRETVITPYGAKNAFPGSYVVTDDYQQSWIVPAEEFNHFLEKVPVDAVE